MQLGKYKGSTSLNILGFQDSPAIWIENGIVLNKVPIFSVSVSSPSVAENHTMYFPASY